MTIKFLKGHGTENDFILVPDPDGKLDTDELGELARVLCDRRAGIGADGVLRVVRTENEPSALGYVDTEETPQWFMDYRNSDGSIAEMCGNGIRVFARYLIDYGLADPGELPIVTRAGVRRVHALSRGDIGVEMGPVTIGPNSTASVAGQEFSGTVASVGNPHLVCVTAMPVGAINLVEAPKVDPAVFPDGTNVEFVNVIAPDHAVMRVFERGSGETRSCGTAATAVAAVLARDNGVQQAVILVDVPGGQLAVTVSPQSCVLSGPAVLVAAGEWLGSL